jgi:hypothetical protein
MTKTLSQIISDGTLVDNAVYQAEAGVFRAGSFGPALEIWQGGGRKNPWTAWPLIHKAATLRRRKQIKVATQDLYVGLIT